MLLGRLEVKFYFFFFPEHFDFRVFLTRHLSVLLGGSAPKEAAEPGSGEPLPGRLKTTTTTKHLEWYFDAGLFTE